MQIEIIHTDGLGGILETTSMEPLGRGVLAVEYELSFETIWLNIRHHDAKHRDPDDQSALPEAARYIGWKLWFVAPEVVEDVVEIIVDGETLAIRIADQLVQTSQIDAMARAVLIDADGLSYVKKIAALDTYLSDVDAESGTAGSIIAHAQTLGIPVPVLEIAIEVACTEAGE